MTEANEATTSQGDGIGGRERVVTASVLALIALLAIVDLAVDLREGVTKWHVLAEALAAGTACFGAFYLLRGAWELRRRLNVQAGDFSTFRRQAEAWRAESKNYVEGLSLAIARQLDQWQLSDAEKEVAFLLLKGLSLKDIASVRRTTEKTARVQSSAVYAKSGLAGRSELSAFFLEELLPPAAVRASTERN